MKFPMRNFMFRFFLVVLTAGAATAARPADRPALPADRLPPVYLLFPETSIEGEGWRGLLPIMLFNLAPQAGPISTRTERGQAPTR